MHLIGSASENINDVVQENPSDHESHDIGRQTGRENVLQLLKVRLSLECKAHAHQGRDTDVCHEPKHDAHEAVEAEYSRSDADKNCCEQPGVRQGLQVALDYHWVLQIEEPFIYFLELLLL